MSLVCVSMSLKSADRRTDNSLSEAEFSVAARRLLHASMYLSLYVVSLPLFLSLSLRLFPVLPTAIAKYRGALLRP